MLASASRLLRTAATRAAPVAAASSSSSSALLASGARLSARRAFADAAASTSARPFQILGVQQIAVGSLDAKALSNFWVNLLGIPKVGDFTSKKENVSEDILKMGSGPYAVEIDLMQPLDPTVAPKVHDPALNHIDLWVDDLKACVDHLTQQGVRFTPGGIRKGASGHDVCFIHPKGNAEKPFGACGVLVELVQAPPDVVKALK